MLIADMANLDGQTSSPQVGTPSPDGENRHWTFYDDGGPPLFLIVSRPFHSSQIALSYATAPSPDGVSLRYYVAWRWVGQELESADSRTCPFGDLVAQIPDLAPSQFYVPGLKPWIAPPGPPAFHAPPYVIQNRPVALPDNSAGADVTVVAYTGAIPRWIEALATATETCWKKPERD